MTAEERREHTLYDAGFRAGRSSGLEEAAQWIDNANYVQISRELYAKHKGKDCMPDEAIIFTLISVAAAIRALKP